MTKFRPPDRPEPEPPPGDETRAVVDIRAQDDILRARQASRGAARAMLSRHQRDEPRASELWTRPRR